MELIIKIPDEQYNDIVKHLTDNDGNYAYSDFNLREIIRNGTPYNPTGDCISREALKEEIRREVGENRIGVFVAKRIFKLIDNAPTVKLSLLPADESKDEAYMRGYKHGKVEGIVKGMALADRPQGEWSYGEDECGQDGWFCSKCGFFVPWYYQYYEKDIDFIREYKACPHCLAEMVTYTGKDRDTKGGAE